MGELEWEYKGARADSQSNPQEPPMTSDQVKTTVTDAASSVKDAASNAAEAVKEAASTAKDKATHAAGAAKEKATDAARAAETFWSQSARLYKKFLDGMEVLKQIDTQALKEHVALQKKYSDLRIDIADALGVPDTSTDDELVDAIEKLKGSAPSDAT